MSKIINIINQIYRDMEVIKMKFKKILSIFCAASVFFFNNGTSAYAAEISTTESSVSELSNEVETPDNVPDSEPEYIAEDEISLEELRNLTAQSDTATDNTSVKIPDMLLNISTYLDNTKSISLNDSSDIELEISNLDSSAIIADLSSIENSRSASSATNYFTDYLSEKNDSKYVVFPMSEGMIVNATLQSPNKSNLDYNLVLGRVDDEGNVTLFKDCPLTTYIDPNTNKTLDESISYVHNEATVGTYAVFVVSVNGGSSTDSFTLTLSLDAAGSYDNNEPNDNAFEAVKMSGLSADGTLHVENDQDWYVTSGHKGPHNVTAGNYKAEVYYAVGDNQLAMADFLDGNYILSENIVYYIKVYSNTKGENFTYGNYTLQLTDKSMYSTMETAFDFGDWENAKYKKPTALPRGQIDAFYKFSLDAEDKVYANIFPLAEGAETILIFYDNNGKPIDYGFTGSESVTDLPVKGLITRNNSSLKSLVVNVDGTKTNKIAYIQVVRLNPRRISASGAPFIDTRIKSARGTYTFSGTTQNSGNGTSTVLTLDLTNVSGIPKDSIVKDIYTTSDISNSVGGIHHQLNPNGLGWISAKTTNAEHGTFDINESDNLKVKQLWGFRYTQAAYMSTTMRNVQLNIQFNYDIQHTNYEILQ